MKVQYQSKELILFESALFRTTTSLLLGKDYVLLVDPNWLPIELDFIEKTIDAVGKGKEKYLLFTHSDYDHIIGYGQFKEYKTIASKNFVHSSSKEQVLKDIAKFDDEYYVKRAYLVEYPRIDRVVAGEGEALKIAGEDYVFFQARGHNADGLITYNKTKGILIAGDYLSNIEFPYIYDSVGLYLETLSKFETLVQEENITLLISGHGDATADKTEMLARIQTSRAYIHQLIAAATSKSIFKEKELLEQYDFPIIMKQFHLKNLELAKAEYSSS